MPTFHPFRGLRYDVSLVTIDDVIAPPYDVVDAPERAALAGRSPYNSILVELPEDDPAQGLDRYQVAANLLADWQAKGVLRRDGRPGFYGYSMEYTGDDGAPARTTGVLGGLGLAGASDGEILPHEETMPKPKGDRLYLLRAARTNLSPIWGLSPVVGLTGLCLSGSDSERAVSASDSEGIVHTLWPIDDVGATEEIAARIGSAPVVIADGHHRFETALNYREEIAPVSPDATGGADAVLAYVVELSEEQLRVRPIHRIVSGLPDGFDVQGFFGARFACETCDPAVLDRGAGYLCDVGAMALATREGTWLLRDQTMSGPGKGGDVLGELDSVRLRAALDALPSVEVAYEADWKKALGAVTSGSAQCAVMIRPVTVDQISRAAGDRVRMPPKTTYFHPKPRTGMVFRPLDP